MARKMMSRTPATAAIVDWRNGNRYLTTPPICPPSRPLSVSVALGGPAWARAPVSAAAPEVRGLGVGLPAVGAAPGAAAPVAPAAGARGSDGRIKRLMK